MKMRSTGLVAVRDEVSEALAPMKAGIEST